MNKLFRLIVDNKADKPREGEGEFGTPRGDHRHGGIDIVGKVGDPIESMRPSPAGKPSASGGS